MTMLLLIAAFAAEPSPAGDHLALLKTFRGEFIEITPGEGRYPARFVMGNDEGPPDERPAHSVEFGYRFFVAKYEVPQNLWEAVTGGNPSRWKGERNSVEMLSFAEAAEFCRRVTMQMRAAGLIAADQEVRLPSEAEWEYVARAGTASPFSFGDRAKLDEHAWHAGNAAGNDPPVGAKKPNPWGLYDVHGYLAEWCLDTAHDNYDGAPADGSAWTKMGDEERRVIRGGSWKDAAERLTSSFRRGLTPGDGAEDKVGEPAALRDDAVGLRCILAKSSGGETSQ